MKASELIEKLKHLTVEYGDLECTVINYSEDEDAIHFVRDASQSSEAVSKGKTNQRHFLIV